MFTYLIGPITCKGVTLLIILPTMSEPTLSINCLLLGSGSSEVFTVEILKTKSVYFLKERIKEKLSPHLNDVDTSDLTIWKVSLPADTISPALTVDGVKESQSLLPWEEISSIFGEALVDGYVHILVQPPSPGAYHKLFLELRD
jgi:Crinkler effector protein N-terminal domain